MYWAGWGLAEGWLGFRQSDPIFEKWVGYGLLAALNNKLRDYKDKIGLDNCLLGFKWEAEKLNLQNVLAKGWLRFKDELREVVYSIGLAGSLLVCKSEAEKLNLHNGLAVGRLPFKMIWEGCCIELD